MALHEVRLALGPEKTLDMICEKYPAKHFAKFQAAADHHKFLLVDASDEAAVFQSGLDYKVMRTFSFKDFEQCPWLELRYLTLDTDQQKVMQSILDSWDSDDVRPLGLKQFAFLQSEKHDYEFVLVNCWEDEHDFIKWDNSSDNKVAQFGHAGNRKALVTLYQAILRTNK
ncbi:hypothetical protein SAMN05216431_101183 [Ligilactobacillus sp. WC1T17]|uniref:ABM domain-containing protein n=1 Tax=Ligilactobacillus ruminis TaxID=1623 RepID=A0ABY1A992_9LACO|nr:hypothetical protein SAMN05216431_101183 [Ligilactobacillus ruminis]